MALTMHPSLFVHPGPWLKRNYLDHFGMTVTEVAAHLGVSRQNMSVLLNGHAGLTALMALRFEKAFGISAETLLRMQAGYDLAQARAREGELDVGPMRKVA
ncbi:MAG: HigA family addiction module antitoxin [Novosphingobium sp.]